MSVFIPAASTVGPSVTLEGLQVLERLGGSSGYLEHLNKGISISGRQLAKYVNTSEWNTTICEVKIGVNPIWAWADMHTLDGHKVRLEGWGRADAKSSCGKLLYNNWDELTSAPVSFQAFTGNNGEEGRLEIFFWRGTKYLAIYAGFESSLPSVSFEGTCTWKAEVNTNA
ncbi:unnamed protein product [Rhizoctonia solani]|uniref:Uncharacterized protein n=1 Tax=Rhizoctonia solani TaxID=456999 RepID=A0A8H3CN57_9AGAM|nr:unnamed protein product [Rhizoctonia solani]